MSALAHTVPGLWIPPDAGKIHVARRLPRWLRHRTAADAASLATTVVDIGARVDYNASSKTQAITLTAGVDLLVVRHVNRDNGDVVSAMTYNTVALTDLDAQVDGGSTGYATIWYLKDPDTGSALDLVITLDGSAHRCSFDWLGLSGTHETPMGVVKKASGAGSPASPAALTDGATGDMAIELGYIFQSTPPLTVSADTGQTVDSDGAASTANTDPYMISAHKEWGASYDPSWSYTGVGDSWAFIAVNVLSAAVAKKSRFALRASRSGSNF